MLQQHKHWSVVPGLLVVALLAACNQDGLSPDRSRVGKPSFKERAPCTPGKWTGGGRIDPTGDLDRTAANDDAADEESGPPGSPQPAPTPPFITGKATFGFNVFLGENCSVTKGEIEVNGHVAKLAWHVSIHDGFNAFDNQPVSAETFDDNSGGRCLVVGVPFPPGMTARVNPQGGTEEVQFEVCDNDPGKAQSGRIHGFHVDAMRWRTENKEGEGGDTGLTYLTGGNVVDHS